MAAVSDWTERHRPTSESHLEGNENQRQKIRKWLDDWKTGIPKNKAILLVGHQELVRPRLPVPSLKIWDGM